MSFPTWAINNNTSVSGNVSYSQTDNNPLWNTDKKESFTFHFIDKSNTPQTLWFRNLSLLLKNSSVVKLHVTSNHLNQDGSKNTATYLIKSFTQNNTTYTMNVQFFESTSSSLSIGPLDSLLQFYYY